MADEVGKFQHTPDTQRWEDDDTVVDAADDLRCTPEPELTWEEELARELEKQNAAGLVAAAVQLVANALRSLGRRRPRYRNAP